jgi:carboxylesterase
MRARGYACAGVLLRGHGTTVDDLATATWKDWSIAVDAAATRLAAEYGRIVYVGCSLGALLAIDSASRQGPERVAGVVTLAAALSLGAVTDRALRIALQLGERLPDSRVAKTGGSDIQDAEMRARSPSYLSYPVRAARYFALGQKRVRDVAPTIRMPFLALHGLLDSTAPYASSIELVRIVGSKDSRLVLLPHSGHLVGVDLERDEVVRQLAAFVERIAG